MSRTRLPRRDFLKSIVTAAAAAKSMSVGKLFGSGPKPGFGARGLPTATLGKTGVKVPRIGLGLGSRFCAVEDEDRKRLPDAARLHEVP